MFDPAIGHHAKPNCVERTKLFEAPWVEYRYNECGYRTPESCGPTPDRHVRLAVIGSSAGFGFEVPYKETFSARVSRALSANCGVPVEIQNLAGEDRDWDQILPSLEPAIKLKPSAVIMLIGPVDFELPDMHREQKQSAKQAPSTVMGTLRARLSGLRSLMGAQHLLYSNVDTYLSLYLQYAGRSDYMRQPFSAAWHDRIALADTKLGQIATRLQQDDIPLYVVFIPLRPQAALMSSERKPPPGLYPFAFRNALEEIARRHAIHFVDAGAAIAATPDPASQFYPVDGHVNGSGHGLVAKALLKSLKQSELPALRLCAWNAPAFASTQMSKEVP